MSYVFSPVQTSGNTTVALASGVSITAASIPSAANLRNRAILQCTSLSGGTVLLSGDCYRATIRSLPSQSGAMFVGSSTEPPFSGTGFYLATGEALTIDITNLASIRVFASLSGEKISYCGTQT
jgi:hypothetical protein